ncbi:MAG TPA: SIS domain-containing protein [Jatrophihabitantaceae bacterium]|jgi:fructoselysine-6-P-deglycase FrlB-like protein
MTFVEDEIASQPDCWAAALELAASPLLPAAGERVAVVGCGTSWFVAQCYATLREAAGLGETDAFAASEAPADRSYDRLVAISRSGTTTEVLELLDRVNGPSLAITADPGTPVVELADETISLPFADERSVVQTRFATSTLALLRAHLGKDLTAAIADARTTVGADLPEGALDRGQFTFLGRHWTVGLANEAALKMREASLSWSESYPAMEYRHGPISIADKHSLVWMLGAAPDGLRDEVTATGATWVESNCDPMAELIRAQRLAVAVGRGRDLDPDNPRNLTRSVILDPA